MRHGLQVETQFVKDPTNSFYPSPTKPKYLPLKPYIFTIDRIPHSLVEKGMKRSSKMAPQDDKFHNDATFQCLLSSQRELLSRLNSEQKLVQPPHCVMDTPNMSGQWPYETNHSIGFETFRNDNIALSKRMSLGVGADDLIMPGREFDSDQFSESLYDDAIKKGGKHAHFGGTQKRRRSTLTFLEYIFENGPEPTIPMEPVQKRARNRVEYNDSDDEDYGVVIEDAYSDDDQIIEEDDFSPLKVPGEAKNILITFDAAMGRSQDSQQQIHDWDKKMGLKRSHSKTMRLSSRSRKLLRQFTQKDIVFLSASE
ncbi:hypothetical protein MHU86_11989 [Fragilaria crotonensis]|nr:hypothetical protein MHU86_11989 [Fragilaria crotonensis]